ncbi:hypothetical protein LCGC14_2971260, partial [marine sediment metagenome]
LYRLLEMAEQFGHRVGLHGCIYSLARDDYARQREFLSRAAGREVTWHRNHYLVYDPVRSPGQLARAGVRVDSSCGLNDANCFRGGTAHPHLLWDWQQQGPSPVIEVPIVFMDQAMPGNPTPEVEWAQLYRQLELSEAVGGAVSVLFHVDYFVANPECLDRYACLLEWLNGRGANLSFDPVPEAATVRADREGEPRGPTRAQA